MNTFTAVTLNVLAGLLIATGFAGVAQMVDQAPEASIVQVQD